jgi:hypothetical protein
LGRDYFGETEATRRGQTNDESQKTFPALILLFIYFITWQFYDSHSIHTGFPIDSC